MAKRTYRIRYRELLENDNERAKVPADQRFGELYAVAADGLIVGITDEYGSCHYAAEPDWTKEEIEEIVADADGAEHDYVRSVV